MTEIYQLFEVEKYNDVANKDKGEIKRLLWFWEKENDIIRNVFGIDKFKLESNNDICDTLKDKKVYEFIFEDIDEYSTIELEVHKTNQQRGVYYPRIFKPILSSDDIMDSVIMTRKKISLRNDFPFNEPQLINSLEQLATLIELLNKTFRTVFPCEENMNVFGFDIRNQIILACAEFESQISGILKDNNIDFNGKFYTTCDYVKLNKILKLSEYEVSFKYYPDLPFFSPFAEWNEVEPTKSLEWYYNYNAVKHDRESNFSKGRLMDLLNAISGCYIMLFAQYGNLSLINERLNNYLEIRKYPTWNPEDKLIKPLIKKEWRMGNYNV